MQGLKLKYEVNVWLFFCLSIGMLAFAKSGVIFKNKDSFGVNTTVQACLCCEAKLQWQLATMIRVSDNIYLLSNGKYLANLTNLRNTFASKRTKRRFVSRIYAVSQNSTSGSNLTLSRVEFRIANIHSSDGKALRRSLIDPDSLRQFSIRIRHSDGHKLTSTPVKLQTVATDMCRVHEMTIGVVQEQTRYLLKASAPRYTVQSACSKYLTCGWFIKFADGSSRVFSSGAREVVVDGEDVGCGAVVCYNCSFPSCVDPVPTDFTCRHIGQRCQLLHVPMMNIVASTGKAVVPLTTTAPIILYVTCVSILQYIIVLGITLMMASVMVILMFVLGQQITRG